MKANLKSLRFRDPKTGNECGIELNIDTLSVLNEQLQIEVYGWHTNYKDKKRTEEIYMVEYLASEDRILVKRNNEVVARINLETSTDYKRTNNLPDNFENLDGPKAFDAVCGIMDNSSDIVGLINNIPAVDPIFGCILKSGISTTIGQIVKCHKNVSKGASVRKKISDILKCLGANKMSMLAKFTTRALKCMLFLGWDIF